MLPFTEAQQNVLLALMSRQHRACLIPAFSDYNSMNTHFKQNKGKPSGCS